MLRVGLTGGLGSGKSTVLRLLAARGAHTLSADELGRSLMQPGQPVFADIVRHFGPSILTPAGTLDRPALARLAFSEGRVEELNAIVHPATIALQQQLAAELAASDPRAILAVESALLFETRHNAPDTGPATASGAPFFRQSHRRKGGVSFAASERPSWRSRFDSLVLVTAPDPVKIDRFVARSLAANPALDPDSIRQQAARILARQLPDAAKVPQVEYVLSNDSTLEVLTAKIEPLWQSLQSDLAATL